ncbi:MAG: hypothetical protein DRP71_04540 [Verrucomicrobia bacterium]|nr:MAG: hypothetical protein DRP71_04540 [Verrucomicrobiota bacterium]
MSSQSSTSALRAGFGKSDITPRVGVQLAGFGPYLNRHSTGVHAPLVARAAAFSSVSETCLILALDLCGVSRQLLNRIRSIVAKRTDVPVDRIMVACTHTHSGPSTVGHIGWGHPDDLYIETLPSRILRAAEAAIEDMGEVRVGSASPPCEGIAINRDYDTAYDRSFSVDHFLADSWRPAKPEKTDTTCDVITFHDGARLKGFISSFSCHPVVCCEENTLIHGDFVGQATSQVEKQHSGSIGIFIPGALGDINPGISHRPADESMRALDVISTRYAQAVETGISSSRPLSSPGLSVASRHTRFPRVEWTREEVDERISVLEKGLHAPDLNDDPLQGDDPLERTGMQMVRLAGLRKILDRMDRGDDLNPSVELQGIRLGSVRLLGSPFEVFQQTKNEIRASAPEGLNLVLSLVNGTEGYAPDPTIFERQGYAAEFVPLMKGDLPHQSLHDLLVGELTQLAAEL